MSQISRIRREAAASVPEAAAPAKEAVTAEAFVKGTMDVLRSLGCRPTHATFRVHLFTSQDTAVTCILCEAPAPAKGKAKGPAKGLGKGPPAACQTLLSFGAILLGDG